MRRWIAEKSPKALVRFGEGEARLMCAATDDPFSIRVARRKIRRQTGTSVSAATMFDVRSDIMRAFDEADIIGFRGRDGLPAEHRMWLDRIEPILQQRAGLRQHPTVVTHCWVNKDIFEALPILLRPSTLVTLVSCRNVKPVMEDRYGLRNVRVYQIPSHFLRRSVDGEYENQLHDTMIWPDFMNDLRRRVSVREAGEIFLIAAGLFGKGLCIDVRGLGGIAVDLGSSADKLVGKQWRRDHKLSGAALK